MGVGFVLVLTLEQSFLTFAEPPPQQLLTPADPDGGPQWALRSFVLLFSLSLHSAFEGVATGLLEGGGAFLGLAVHRGLVAFSLTFRLAWGRLRRTAVAGCLLVFAAAAPLGVAVGMVLAEVGAPPQHRLARSTLEGLATGTFVYVTFVEILPRDLRSTANRIAKMAATLLGFAVVAAVLFIRL